MVIFVDKLVGLIGRLDFFVLNIFIWIIRTFKYEGMKKKEKTKEREFYYFFFQIGN